MNIINQAGRYSLGILILLVIMVSCATINNLKVNYRLPPKSDELKGRKVFLSFKDIRTVKDILGKGAREDFIIFSGNISLSLARGEEEGFKIGVYDLPSFFMEAFKRNLENSGIEVVAEREKSEVELAIVLKDFLLDLIDRKWEITMGYEARLIKDKKVLAKQMMSGQAERFKLIGLDQADVVVGEIFTDMVNRLDLGRLFRQARL